jgi:hypothetical protein
MIVKSEPYSQLKPECFVAKTMRFNASTIKSQQMTSQSFIPFRIISDFMFYTFLSPYKIHFDETSGDFGMRTYFWHKVNELARTNWQLSQTLRVINVNQIVQAHCGLCARIRIGIEIDGSCSSFFSITSW